MIEDYDFGRMIIDGKEYTADLIILKDRIISDWWRKEGHSLLPEDLEQVLDEKPEMLIVGRGHSGFMRVDPKTLRLLESKGITVIEDQTARAVEVFNGLQGKKAVAGAFHLTC